jgi:hypothetical protein
MIMAEIIDGLDELVVNEGSIGKNLWYKYFGPDNIVFSRELKEEEIRSFNVKVKDVMKSIPSIIEQQCQSAAKYDSLEFNVYSDFCGSVNQFLRMYERKFGTSPEEMLPNFPKYELNPELGHLDEMIHNTQRRHLIGSFGLAIAGFFGGAIGAGYGLESITDNHLIIYCLDPIGALIGSAIGAAIPQLMEIPVVEHYKSRKNLIIIKDKNEFLAQIKEYINPSHGAKVIFD